MPSTTNKPSTKRGSSRLNEPSNKRNRPATSLITEAYDYMKGQPGKNFTIEELSKQLGKPPASMRRSLSKSLNNHSDSYPGLHAYDDDTYAFSAPDEPAKPQIKGNTQTETFASALSVAEDVTWLPGAIVTVCGQLPTGEVIVAHRGQLHMMEMTWIGSIPE